MQQRNLCIHCDPYPNSSRHVAEKIEQLVAPIIALCNPFERLMKHHPRLHAIVNRIVLGFFLRTLLAFNILREVEVSDFDEGIHNRSLVVVREARKRGMVIKSLQFFGKGTKHFSIVVNGTKRFFEGLPHLVTEYSFPVGFDDKGTLKELLEKEGLPHPRGRAFREYAHAVHYVRSTLGFPVVVKPRSGSLSKHTTCTIRTEEQLHKAVAIAKILDREFVVEEHIEGGVQRVTMVDGDMIASCLREPPNVIGDAEHTVRELVEIKNQDPRRGAPHQKNCTLHRISITARTHSLLASQQMALDAVPPQGKKVFLHDKVILACGADIHDTTDRVHPENKILFKKVSALCRAPIIGIDIIMNDIAQPHYEQRCGVLEVNSLPYIDMHHYPVTGLARNVAGRILDYCSSRYDRTHEDPHMRR